MKFKKPFEAVKQDALLLFSGFLLFVGFIFLMATATKIPFMRNLCGTCEGVALGTTCDIQFCYGLFPLVIYTVFAVLLILGVYFYGRYKSHFPQAKHKRKLYK